MANYANLSGHSLSVTSERTSC